MRVLKGLFYRAVWRLADPYAYFESAPLLPEDLVKAQGLFNSREAMLRALPKGGRVAEVGVATGYFSKHIAEVCQPDELHLIDLTFARLVEVLPIEPVKHEGNSSTILRGFPGGFFDWIYIDGDHSHAGTSADLEAAHHALKPGGFLVCNDYTNWMSLAVEPYGVMRAVNEFIIKRGYSVEGLSLSKYGNPDILIRKPAA